jgi:hypothetical protein
VAPPAIDSHNVLALNLSESAGVAPDLRAHADLAEPLLFGPMLPARYRLDGPGAQPRAAARVLDELARSPRAPVEPDDVSALPDVGLGDLAPVIEQTLSRPGRPPLSPEST